jgi:hypothetical protein
MKWANARASIRSFGSNNFVVRASALNRNCRLNGRGADRTDQNLPQLQRLTARAWRPTRGTTGCDSLRAFLLPFPSTVQTGKID